MIHQITSVSDFENIISNNPNVLMEFYASWCPHCKAFYPVLEAASNQLAGEGVVTAQTEIDTFDQIAEAYGIESIPTLVYFLDGQAVTKSEGERSEQAVIEFVAQSRQQ